MHVMTEFTDGATIAIAVVRALESQGIEGTAVRLAEGIAQMMNGYYDLLVRMGNRQETEIQVLQHVAKFMPKTMYPGDMRVEQESVDETTVQQMPPSSL